MLVSFPLALNNFLNIIHTKPSIFFNDNASLKMLPAKLNWADWFI